MITKKLQAMIYSLRVFLPVLALLWSLSSQALAFGPLIDAKELDTLMKQGEVVVLDIRFGKVKETKKTFFETGHIPSSLHAPYKLFRGPKENPGRLVSQENLTPLLQNLGLDRSKSVVIAYQGTNQSDFGAAARVYWTLKSSGLFKLAILNGGINAWKAAGFKLEQGPSPEVEPTFYEVNFDPTWLATTEDVKKIVAGDNETQLVDARTPPFWEGNAKHKAAAKPGTLPKSVNVVHNIWFDKEKKTLINASLAQSQVSEKGFKQGDDIVSFCNTGHWAATNWFAMSEIAGIDGVKLYPESMVEWSHTDNEMINVPGYFRNLWNKVIGNY